MLMTVQEALQFGQANIKLESARVDCEFLLSHVLNKSITWLKTWPDYQLSEQEEQAYRTFIERRSQGEPVAYIVGEKAFWKLELYTDPSTLIPRPETELLVELALEHLNPKEKAYVLDLGTGTGAIALSIALERKNDQVMACDLNSEAVKLAKKNAQRNNIDNAQIIQSDWFSNVPATLFDLIVANPPYVAENDPHLQQGDLVFEPNKALVAKDDGFADLQKIINEAKNFLKPGGVLLLEHGYQQGEKVREIFSACDYQKIKTEKDLAGLDRVSLGSKIN